MTSSSLLINQDVINQQLNKGDQQCIDLEMYRKLVKNLLDLRRYESALFWAEKITVFSNQNPKDVYQLAHCMFMLREYTRASHIIRKSGLEKQNLLCLTLLIESLHSSNEHQEALSLLNSIEIEDLNTSIHDDTEADANHKSNETLKNVSKTSLIFFFAGK
jgi:anaphase-promoting complex subunit 6